MGEPTEQGIHGYDLTEVSIEKLGGLARDAAKRAEQAQEQTERCRGEMRAAAAELTDRVGRQGAAKVLGITPRELAGILRSAKPAEQ